MMQVKIIDRQTFIAMKNGKRESILTPAEATAEAHSQIKIAGEIIASLLNAENETARKIQAAVLGGEDATKHRTELAEIQHEIKDHERDQRTAQATIDEVINLLDSSAAEAIRQADTTRLNELITPFNNAIKEYQA